MDLGGFSHLITTDQSQENRETLSQLLNLAFGVETGSAYYDDFPVWDPHVKVDKRKIIQAQSNTQFLQATASGRICNLQVPTGLIPVGLIGAVATHPDCRGKGLASDLVKKILHWMEDEGCAIVFLWGSEHDLYRRLGFELGGVQGRLKVSNLLSGYSLKEPHTPIKLGYDSKIFEMMKKRKGGLKLETSDQEWLSRHKNVEWMRNERSYLAIGRGIDLPNIVHEWGGDNAGLLELLSAVVEKNPEAEIIGPVLSTNPNGFDFESGVLEFVSMSKILDPKKLFESFWPEYEFKSERLPEDQFQLLFKSGTQLKVTSQQLTQIFTNASNQISLPYLPLPIWIWGLDSA